MSGKGSAPRPMPDYKTFSNNYDLIFKKKNEPVQNNPSPKCPLALPTNEREKGKES